MKKTFFLFAAAGSLLMQQALFAHCQMPCGVYHDGMVYDQIDQYIETTFKGLSILNESKFQTVKEKNEFVRWVMLKEKDSDEVANLICTYFLQQKIKAGEANTDERLRSAHRLLFLAMQIKQNTDKQFLEDFTDEWNRFKLMFHVENYECQIEQVKQRKREQLKEELSKKDAAKAKSQAIAITEEAPHKHGEDDEEHTHGDGQEPHTH